MARARIAAGHLTSGIDAAEFLARMDGFLDQVVAGDIPATDTTTFGKMTRSYELQDGKLGFEGFAETFDDFLGAARGNRSLAHH